MVGVVTSMVGEVMCAGDGAGEARRLHHVVDQVSHLPRRGRGRVVELLGANCSEHDPRATHGTVEGVLVDWSSLDG